MGAAIGDVMGNCLNGKNKLEIKNLYGEKGITAPPHDSLISHNYQLILFAIDALILSARRNKKLNISEIASC
jgi:ADP-ribosylglycohydrolase